MVFRALWGCGPVTHTVQNGDGALLDRLWRHGCLGFLPGQRMTLNDGTCQVQGPDGQSHQPASAVANFLALEAGPVPVAGSVTMPSSHPSPTTPSNQPMGVLSDSSLHCITSANGRQPVSNRRGALQCRPRRHRRHLRDTACTTRATDRRGRLGNTTHWFDARAFLETRLMLLPTFTDCGMIIVERPSLAAVDTSPRLDRAQWTAW